MTTHTQTVYRILFTISIVHLLNDSIQAVIPAVLPILQKNLALSYFELGLILFVTNVTASVLQPVIGYFSDRTPRPYMLPLAMLISGLGMLVIGFTGHYSVLLISAALVGIGSAVFHPEASRVAYMASGPRRGLGQSIFQVGGNAGQALAPLMSVLLFVPLGQTGAAWFSIVAGMALCVLVYVAMWYWGQQRQKRNGAEVLAITHRDERYVALLLLIVLVSVRSWVHAGFQSFYPLYLINVQGIEISLAQFYIFLFLLAGAIGTFFGGPIADRLGKRNLLIFSLLGGLPLSLMIPYVQGAWAYLLLFMDGLILLSSFSVTVVYAQELLPGRIGMVSGLITGFAFGMGGIGASVLGYLADWFSLSFVITLCSILPAVGFLGFMLPRDKTLYKWEQESAHA